MTPLPEASEMGIVLTATIVPQTGGASSMNPEERLAEYSRTLRFCLGFCPVIFLENSDYPLSKLPPFAESDSLRVHRFRTSLRPERGKGYQEFEMLDSWLACDERPPARWLKISGRYQILNLGRLINECRRESRNGLIIDQTVRSKMARTYTFCVTTEFYRKNMVGLYQKCDDRTGAWVERVLYKELRKHPASEVRSFCTQPRIQAVAGSSGAVFPSGRGSWLLKQSLRWFNRLFDRQRLWYSN